MCVEYTIAYQSLDMCLLSCGECATNVLPICGPLRYRVLNTPLTPITPQATVAILRHVLEMRRRLPSTPLTSWAKTRWMDLAWTIEWLFDHAPELSAPHAEELLNTLHMLHAQGFDREEWFEQMSPLGAQGDRHNVNVAQGLKSSAVLWRFNSSFTHNGLSLPELSLRRMARLDKEVGLPTGMYNGTVALSPYVPKSEIGLHPIPCPSASSARR